MFGCLTEIHKKFFSGDISFIFNVFPQNAKKIGNEQNEASAIFLATGGRMHLVNLQNWY